MLCFTDLYSNREKAVDRQEWASVIKGHKAVRGTYSHGVSTYTVIGSEKGFGLGLEVQLQAFFTSRTRWKCVADMILDSSTRRERESASRSSCKGVERRGIEPSGTWRL